MLKKRLIVYQSILLLLMVVGINKLTYAQNLIPNPGFERYTDCPSEDFGLYLAADWHTNIPWDRRGNGTWNSRNYIHTCDPEVTPWWPEELGDGIIGYLHHWSAREDKSLTQLVWSELLSAPEKDSLYYVEYTSTAAQVYFVPENRYVMPWCLPFNLGIKLVGADFDGVVDELDPIVPDMTAGESGIGRRIANTTQVGNCFVATGEERHLLLGFFLDDTPLEEYSCVGTNTYSEFGWAFCMLDNVKLEKMKLEIRSDTTICSKEKIDFSEYTNYYALPEKQIVWNDGVEGVERSFPTSGQYRISMITNCGSVTSNWINVTLEECSARVYVPNAFSPNGDTRNPLFVPKFSDDYVIETLRFSIFDRWGQVVFQTNDVDTPGWDGTVQGVMANTGTYIWQLEFGYVEGEEMVTKLEYGEVVLVR